MSFFKENVCLARFTISRCLVVAIKTHWSTFKRYAIWATIFAIGFRCHSQGPPLSAKKVLEPRLKAEAMRGLKNVLYNVEPTTIIENPRALLQKICRFFQHCFLWKRACIKNDWIPNGMKAVRIIKAHSSETWLSQWKIKVILRGKKDLFLIRLCFVYFCIPKRFCFPQTRLTISCLNSLVKYLLSWKKLQNHTRLSSYQPGKKTKLFSHETTCGTPGTQSLF